MSDTYNQHYSEDGFWKKAKKFARSAGATVMRPAFELYYVIESSHTPIWAKALSISGLGYFILPVDLIPDIIPVAGFTDDLGIMLHTLHTIAHYITDEITNKARNSVNKLIGL